MGTARPSEKGEIRGGGGAGKKVSKGREGKPLNEGRSAKGEGKKKGELLSG